MQKLLTLKLLWTLYGNDTLGSHFVNTVVTSFLKESNGLHKMIAAYISQTAGTVEVQNKSVLKNLRSLVSEFGLKEDQWYRILTLVQGF
eukprot:snap_masked-scaffold_67-processed-gene-0.53-mRNA-1 protein AED:1.00 eAED:1.00 QI:0/0/0/0/1/1/2/0/88